jgi:hypothetical protein
VKTLGAGTPELGTAMVVFPPKPPVGTEADQEAEVKAAGVDETAVVTAGIDTGVVVA